VPHLPYSVELHDSFLASLVKKNDAAVLQLRPAYIHRDGKGWRQNADLNIGRAEVELGTASLPAKLADGRMKTEQGPYHNLLELPLKVVGPIALTLELFSEAVIRVVGINVEVVLHGEAEYVEDVA
jgi:hypothetical protein